MMMIILLLQLHSLLQPSDAACKCGQENLSRRIINGKEALKNRYPWMVSIGFGCGGSLITDRHVLTAAHCLQGGQTASSVKIILGAHTDDERRSLPSLPVQSIKVHENYEPNARTKMSDDIAIIKLKSAVQFSDVVSPVCLPDFSQHDNLFLTGWGYQNSNRQKVKSQSLFEVDLPEVDNKTCSSRWGQQFESGKELCAGDHRGGCQGDSGGPLSTRKDGYVYQVGVVSFGPSDCNVAGSGSDTPNVYERVTFHLEWIKKQTDGGLYCAAPRHPFMKNTDPDNSGTGSGSNGNPRPGMTPGLPARPNGPQGTSPITIPGSGTQPVRPIPAPGRPVFPVPGTRPISIPVPGGSAVIPLPGAGSSPISTPGNQNTPVLPGRPTGPQGTSPITIPGSGTQPVRPIPAPGRPVFPVPGTRPISIPVPGGSAVIPLPGAGSSPISTPGNQNTPVLPGRPTGPQGTSPITIPGSGTQPVRPIPAPGRPVFPVPGSRPISIPGSGSGSGSAPLRPMPVFPGSAGSPIPIGGLRPISTPGSGTAPITGPGSGAQPVLPNSAPGRPVFPVPGTRPISIPVPGGSAVIPLPGAGSSPISTPGNQNTPVLPGRPTGPQGTSPITIPGSGTQPVRPIPAPGRPVFPVPGSRPISIPGSGSGSGSAPVRPMPVFPGTGVSPIPIGGSRPISSPGSGLAPITGPGSGAQPSRPSPGRPVFPVPGSRPIPISVPGGPATIPLPGAGSSPISMPGNTPVLPGGPTDPQGTSPITIPGSSNQPVRPNPAPARPVFPVPGSRPISIPVPGSSAVVPLPETGSRPISTPGNQNTPVLPGRPTGPRGTSPITIPGSGSQPVLAPGRPVFPIPDSRPISIPGSGSGSAPARPMPVFPGAAGSPIPIGGSRPISTPGSGTAPTRPIKTGQCTCGMEAVRTRIRNGKEASKSYPWMASIIGDAFVCAGSLINSKYILTAAHCVKGKEASQLKVTLSAHTELQRLLSPSVEIMNVKIHEAFDGQVLNDVALLELRHELPDIENKPVCLPTPSMPKPATAPFLIGWGSTNNAADDGLLGSKVLREAELDLQSDDACRSFYGSMATGKTCAGTCRGATKGDGGSPLMERTDGRVYQVGVTCFGNPSVCSQPDLFETVSPHYDWIHSNTQDATYCN